MYEYITFETKDAKEIEQKLNEMAQDGWEFVGIAATNRFCIIFRKARQCE